MTGVAPALFEIALVILLRPVEHRGAVLRTHTRPLPIRRRGVMAVPEDIEQLLVGDLRRIVNHLYCLRVSGPVGADVFVGRVLQAAARVAHARGADTRHAPERRLHAPETTGSERCSLHVGSPKREGANKRIRKTEWTGLTGFTGLGL